MTIILVIALCVVIFFIAGMVADTGDYKTILAYWLVNSFFLTILLTKDWESVIPTWGGLTILAFGVVGFIFGTYCYLERNRKPAW